MEAHGAAVHQGFGVDGRRPVNPAAESQIGIGGGRRNAALGLVQAAEHFLGGIADGRDDAHPVTTTRRIVTSSR